MNIYICNSSMWTGSSILYDCSRCSCRVEIHFSNFSFPFFFLWLSGNPSIKYTQTKVDKND